MDRLILMIFLRLFLGVCLWQVEGVDARAPLSRRRRLEAARKKQEKSIEEEAWCATPRTTHQHTHTHTHNTDHTRGRLAPPAAARACCRVFEARRAAGRSLFCFLSLLIPTHARAHAVRAPTHNGRVYAQQTNKNVRTARLFFDGAPCASLHF
jgi:hypothetical protein